MIARAALKTWGLDTPRETGGWQEHGACRADPETWVGDHHGAHNHYCNHALARHICLRHCPVLDQCRPDAQAHPHWYADTVTGATLWIRVKGPSSPHVRAARVQPGDARCSAACAGLPLANAADLDPALHHPCPTCKAAAGQPCTWSTLTHSSRLALALEEAGWWAMPDRRSIPLETQSITPQCRTNRGPIPAWWAAVDQLREVYDAQVRAHPGDTFELVIRRVPEPAEDVKLAGDGER